MPILDPILQFNLSTISNTKLNASPKYFYINYLKIASLQINYNITTILVSSQFKDDFEKCKSVILNRSGILFHGKIEEFPNLYYTLLYQNGLLEPKEFDFQGEYYQYSFFNSIFNFFKLNIDDSNYRSWFLSDSPIAILVIHLNKMNDVYLNLIIFELNLMAAAGFTLVVCLNDFTNSKLTKFDQLIEILRDHFVSEIHITFDSNKYDTVFDKFIDELSKHYYEFDGFIYLYVRYFDLYDDLSSPRVIIPLKDLTNKEDREIFIPLTSDVNESLITKLNEKLNKLESEPHMKITYFSDSIEKLFKLDPVSNKQFDFCKTGFNKREDESEDEDYNDDDDDEQKGMPGNEIPSDKKEGNITNEMQPNEKGKFDEEKASCRESQDKIVSPNNKDILDKEDKHTKDKSDEKKKELGECKPAREIELNKNEQINKVENTNRVKGHTKNRQANNIKDLNVEEQINDLSKLIPTKQTSDKNDSSMEEQANKLSKTATKEKANNENKTNMEEQIHGLSKLIPKKQTSDKNDSNIEEQVNKKVKPTPRKQKRNKNISNIEEQANKLSKAATKEKVSNENKSNMEEQINELSKLIPTKRTNDKNDSNIEERADKEVKPTPRKQKRNKNVSNVEEQANKLSKAATKEKASNENNSNTEEQINELNKLIPKKQKSDKNISKTEEQTNKLKKASTKEKASDKNDSNMEEQANKEVKPTPKKQKRNINDSNMEEQANKEVKPTPKKQKRNINDSNIEGQTNKLSKAATKEKASDKNDSNVGDQSNKDDKPTLIKQTSNKNDSNMEEQINELSKLIPKKQTSNKKDSKMKEQTNKLSKEATKEKVSDKNDSNMGDQSNKDDKPTPKKQTSNKNDSNMEEQINELSKLLPENQIDNQKDSNMERQISELSNLLPENLINDQNDSNMERQISELSKLLPENLINDQNNNINEEQTDEGGSKINKKEKRRTFIEKNRIKILISDVPLYENEDDDTCINSTEFTNINGNKYEYYIDPEDFLSFDKSRIDVWFYNEKGKKVVKYIDFDDIHYMNSELYVESQMSLIRAQSSIKNKCNSIINQLKYNQVPREPEPKEIASNASPRNKRKIEMKAPGSLDAIFTKLLQAYKRYHDEKYEKKFELHLSQIYTAYEIITKCLNGNSIRLGTIYQIPTGEGKSAIIFLISAILAQYGKKVHIVTSNFYLTNRDYNESFPYFQSIDIKSSALLHFNEVPIFKLNDMYDPNFLQKNYPLEYFNMSLFNNSLNMNFKSCDPNEGASVVFSTISNFECFYLYMTEKCKDSIDDYYNNTVLLIDEADSILIDEITNGTIISRPLKSNSQVVLTYVYDKYTENNAISPKELAAEILSKWPECTDLSEYDVKTMFKEIDLVRSNDFINGKKYLIVKSEEGKFIVPFDFDNKGIVESNKEFGGFIEQFIAIKEKKVDDSIIYKDISLNYFFISHPVYVKTYKNVFGLTGTIGDSYDRKLLLKHYKLDSKIMPKENPNRCFHFPITFCENIEKRNNLIVEEVMRFHKTKFPVLVIFSSPNEINEIKELIVKHGDFDNTKIDIYQGSDIKFKPNNDAGKEGAISLGTNVCGRGTHIEVSSKKHLHVIITFYSSNKRTLQQAFGRTARKNNFGSVHIICLKEELNSRLKMIDDKEIENNLNRMDIYKNMQKDFINKFREQRNWLFDINLNYTKKLNHEELIKLRQPKMNVNRITACDYKYPICMNYTTFLDIQSQKIFSLLNCPNCKYTWQLFQQYTREMILQSWSILINKIDQSFNCESTPFNDIKKKLEELSDNLEKAIQAYLPKENIKKDQQIDIFKDFLHIFEKVTKEYKIIKEVRLIPSKNINSSNLNDEISDINARKETYRFSRISFEFRPFKLQKKSSSRIRDLMDKSPEISYIEDPELKYKNSKNGKKFSITNTLDVIFEKICNILNDFLEDHLGVKLFLRRTLAGCEFGICFEIDEQNIDPQVTELKNCLFDKDPLFVFSIYLNSTFPFLAGVLIFFALYLISIIKNLITFTKTLSKGLVIDGFKLLQSLKSIADRGIDKGVQKVCDEISEKLRDKILKLIEKFRNTKYERFYYSISLLTNLLVPKAVEKSYSEGLDLAKKLCSKLTENEYFVKVGFLAIIWLAANIIDFNFFFLFNKKLKYDSTVEEGSRITKKENNIQAIVNFTNDISKTMLEKLNLEPLT